MASRITVVVPVYDDWDSLRRCILSVLRHTDARHSVLILNDCGPNSEVLERSVLGLIGGRDNFSYYRNATNLGFVRTCNRAVFELDRTTNDVLLLNSDAAITEGALDEMLAVLHHSDKHGCVSPRSDNASIASIPFMPRSGDLDDRSTQRAEDVFAAVSPLLPRFSVVPVTPGFCMLIRREIIENFGLFDEAFGAGYDEENDFCLRINRYGYSAVMANRALVLHEGSRSFTPARRRQLQRVNAQRLLSRYPYYERVVGDYLESSIDAVDWFADVIAPSAEVKVLILLDRLPPKHNGTSSVAVSFLQFLRLRRNEFGRFAFTVAAPNDSASFHNLASYGVPIVDSRSIEGAFDLGYCPFQIFEFETLRILNKHCLRIVYSHLDIIALRSLDLLSRDIEARSVVLDALTYADRVIAISQFSADDLCDYYGPKSANFADRVQVVRQGAQHEPLAGGRSLTDLDPDAREVVEAGGYLLVIGNDFEHKLIRDTLPLLADLSKPAVVLGPQPSSLRPPNVTMIAGGQLSDEAVRALYRGSSAVFFPSLYEGFGLPIAEAAMSGKPIVLNDTSVAREIGALYEYTVPITYFTLLSDVPAALRSALNGDSEDRPVLPLRTMDDYSAEVMHALTSVVDQSVDTARLRERWRYVQRVAERSAKSARWRNTSVDRAAIYLKQRYPKPYFAARAAYWRLRRS